MNSKRIDPKKHRQLFLDDFAIEKCYGIQRILHPPKRCGPVIRQDLSSGQSNLQTLSAPQWNSEKNLWEWWYGVWYGVSQADAPGLCLYVTSADGIHWDSPSLGFHEWRGSKDNNIARRPGDEPLYHIIRDEREEDPQRRYKALFSSRDRYPGLSPDSGIFGQRLPAAE